MSEIERLHSTERMSRIVKHQGVIYLCGQTAGDENWDIAEQTERCLEKIKGLLEEAGSGVDRMLSVTIYVRDMKDFAAMNEVWDNWFAERPKPARACVEARMARPPILVEMSVVAAENA
ncbi:RidA family protein [Marinobacter bohaiensis]|uniref:RidA family protein n=1 Tax=Marinobacter bohaiensis TaxID=2201898 RepID=UPI000DAE8880|nr:RidA family protein [Marinobacter bohaiensis]